MGNANLEEMRQRIEHLEAENRNLAEQLFNEDRRTENAKQEMREAQAELSTARKRIAELQHSYKWLEQKIAKVQADADDANLSFTKAIEFAIEQSGSEGIDFLRCWLEGDWDGCREWSEDFELHPAIFYPEQKLSEEKDNVM